MNKVLYPSLPDIIDIDMGMYTFIYIYTTKKYNHDNSPHMSITILRIT